MRLSILAINWNDDQMKSFFHVKTNGEYHRIPIEDILYFRSDDNYCRIYTIDGMGLVIRKTLVSIEERLNNLGFLRCHRQFYVNTNAIKSIDVRLSKIQLINGFVIPISRSRKSLVINKFDQEGL